MKKIFNVTLYFALVLFTGYNIYTSQREDEMSDLAIANIEALASGEGGSSSSWSCWSKEKKGTGYWRCGNPCQFIDGATGTGTEGKCYKN